jgi:hypothetical protein
MTLTPISCIRRHFNSPFLILVFVILSANFVHAQPVDFDAVIAELEATNILPPIGSTGDGRYQIAWDIQAMDINEDGFQDLFILVFLGPPESSDAIGWHIQVLINQGDGTFLDETAARFPDQGGEDDISPTFLVLKDMNMDGAIDIFLQTAPSTTLRVLFNDGAGNFTRENFDLGVTSNDMGFANFQDAETHIIDIDGDGGVDVLQQTANAAHTVWLLPQLDEIGTTILSSNLNDLFAINQRIVALECTSSNPLGQS